MLCWLASCTCEIESYYTRLICPSPTYAIIYTLTGTTWSDYLICWCHSDVSHLHGAYSSSTLLWLIYSIFIACDITHAQRCNCYRSTLFLYYLFLVSYVYTVPDRICQALLIFIIIHMYLVCLPNHKFDTYCRSGFDCEILIIASGGFRGVSLVSIETPFVPDTLMSQIIQHLAQFQEGMAWVSWNLLLDKALRDLLWLTLA